MFGEFWEKRIIELVLTWSLIKCNFKRLKFKLDAYLNKDITHCFADGPRNGLREGMRQVSCPLGGGTPYNGLNREAPP